MASEMRDLDEDVSSLSRTLAVRTLQLEMEYVYSALEEEALDVAQDLKGAGFLLLRLAAVTLDLTCDTLMNALTCLDLPARWQPVASSCFIKPVELCGVDKHHWSRWQVKLLLHVTAASCWPFWREWHAMQRCCVRNFWDDYWQSFVMHSTHSPARTSHVTLAWQAML